MPKQMQAVKATTWHNKKPNATFLISPDTAKHNGLWGVMGMLQGLWVMGGLGGRR
jgi:hypothetical protein